MCYSDLDLDFKNNTSELQTEIKAMTNNQHLDVAQQKIEFLPTSHQYNI